MLSTANRLRRSEDFRYVIRRGLRAGRPSVVVHACRRAERAGEPARVGFVVSKAVGNAVVRNRVKRRLRAMTRTTLTERPEPVTATDWVVRALPPAAYSADLEREFRSAWRRCEKRLAS